MSLTKDACRSCAIIALRSIPRIGHTLSTTIALNRKDARFVYGPIANDRIGAQITRYRQGYITFDEFLHRIQYIKGITFQYAFCTQRAIDKLVKI